MMSIFRNALVTPVKNKTALTATIVATVFTLQMTGFLNPQAAYADSMNKQGFNYTVETKYGEDYQEMTVSSETVLTASRDNVTITDPPKPVQKTPVFSGFTGTVDTSNIISIARSFVGKVPYVANSSNPQVGFDCSGFTKYVYAQIGVNLPHSSTAQAALGTVIPFSEAQAGDLLIWDGHVAIYSGGNMMIDAQVSGTMIAEHQIWGSPKVVRL